MSIQILPANRSNYTALIDIWEASVRATHHFLTSDDIVYFRKRILAEYFDAVELYYLLPEQGEPAGLLGLSEGKIEMLFIHPRFFRRGYGSLLADYAITTCGVTLVDVNEDNPGALAFYLAKGFEVVNRLEKDQEGKDLPILQMALTNRSIPPL